MSTSQRLRTLWQGLNQHNPFGASGRSGPCVAVLCACLGVSTLFSPTSAQAQADDFNDGNDTGWTRYDPISAAVPPGVASYSFVNGGYRIRTAPSPLPSAVGPGRAGSIRRDVTYTDFYATVDLVDWDETLQGSVGILARVSDIGLGATDGYVLTYNFRGKDIDITRFTNEDPAGGNLTLTGDDKLEVTKGKKYRLVFYGRGSLLGARVFDLADLSTPLLNVTATDSTYTSGFCGLLVYDNSAGATMSTDTTFDNYFAAVEEPPKLNILDAGFGAVQVVWAGTASNFHLQFADKLTGPWTDIDPQIVFYDAQSDTYSYQDGSDGNRFYRLKKP